MCVHPRLSVVSVAVRLCVCVPLVSWLSGCFRYDLHTTVLPDGSGTNTVRVAFRSLLLEAAAKQPDNPFGPLTVLARVRDLAQQYPAEWQTRIEPFDDGTFGGLRITVRFTDAGMLQQQYDRLASASSPNTEGGGPKIFNRLAVSQQGPRWVFAAEFAGTDFKGAASPLDMRVTYAVSLPQIIDYTPHNALVEPNTATTTVTWHFELDGSPQTVKLVGDTSSDMPWLSAGVIAGVAVLGLIMFGIWWRRRHSSPSPLAPPQTTPF